MQNKDLLWALKTNYKEQTKLIRKLDREFLRLLLESYIEEKTNRAQFSILMWLEETIITRNEEKFRYFVDCFSSNDNLFLDLELGYMFLVSTRHSYCGFYSEVRDRVCEEYSNFIYEMFSEEDADDFLKGLANEKN